MDPSKLNGGSVLAMKGADCFAMACDLRFGFQFQTISTNFEKIFKMDESLYIGLGGLATDVLTVKEETESEVNLYKINENRRVKPQVLMNIMSNLLYKRRFGPFFIEPIICGFDPTTAKPFIASCDLVGCTMVSEDFVAVGTSFEQLQGICESLWRPDMDSKALFETISQAFMNAIDRDAYSGWGVVVYLVEKEKTTRYVLRARMD